MNRIAGEKSNVFGFARLNSNFLSEEMIEVTFGNTKEECIVA